MTTQTKRYAHVPTQRTMARRLTSIYFGASHDVRAAGMAWYPRFNVLAGKLAARHGVTAGQAAGVLAIVSPRVTVGASFVLADSVLAEWRAGTRRIGECRGLKGRVGAAWLWLDGDASQLVLDGGGTATRARKVRSFYANIVGDVDAVTVDVWAARAAGWRGGDQFPNGGAYMAIADAYRAAARRCGVSPRDLQAVVWCAVRSDVDAALELAALGRWLDGNA
jgi:hypothetical protein